MGSLNLKNNSRQCFDQIRKKWVDKQPEEVIRQNLIDYMINRLHYPARLIAVEKEVSGLVAQLKHRPQEKIPKRRIDIALFSDITLRPLLIIECKSIPLNQAATRQVIGYNAFIGAPFVALANGIEVMFGAYDPLLGTYRFEQGLPTFQALTASLRVH